VNNQPDNEFLVAFGEHIKRLRIDKGFSVIELKDRAGISRAQLYRIEAGVTNVSMLTVKHLAEALEVSLSDLIAF